MYTICNVKCFSSMPYNQRLNRKNDIKDQNSVILVNGCYLLDHRYYINMNNSLIYKQLNKNIYCSIKNNCN